MNETRKCCAASVNNRKLVGLCSGLGGEGGSDSSQVFPGDTGEGVGVERQPEQLGPVCRCRGLDFRGGPRLRPMTHLARTAHAQLCALWLSCVGWALSAVALGLVQWRVWLVADREVISSGVAWVGLWRACFHSHAAVSPGFRVLHCRSIGLSAAFAPPEIAAGRVLLGASLLLGLCGNAGGVCGLRSVFSGMEKSSPARRSFLSAGALCLSAAAASLVPLLWNLSSVVTNQTIGFPPEFRLPPEPESQRVGCGIGVGLVGALLMVVSGVIFCTYRSPGGPGPGVHREGPRPAPAGRENPAFESQDHL